MAIRCSVKEEQWNIPLQPPCVSISKSCPSSLTTDVVMWKQARSRISVFDVQHNKKTCS